MNEPTKFLENADNVITYGNFSNRIRNTKILANPVSRHKNYLFFLIVSIISVIKDQTKNKMHVVRRNMLYVR